MSEDARKDVESATRTRDSRRAAAFLNSSGEFYAVNGPPRDERLRQGDRRGEPQARGAAQDADARAPAAALPHAAHIAADPRRDAAERGAQPVAMRSTLRAWGDAAAATARPCRGVAPQPWTTQLQTAIYDGLPTRRGGAAPTMPSRCVRGDDAVVPEGSGTGRAHDAYQRPPALVDAGPRDAPVQMPRPRISASAGDLRASPARAPAVAREPAPRRRLQPALALGVAIALVLGRPERATTSGLRAPAGDPLLAANPSTRPWCWTTRSSRGRLHDAAAPPRRHVVEVSKPGYLPFAQTSSEAGQRLERIVQLESLGSAAAPKAPGGPGDGRAPTLAPRRGAAAVQARSPRRPPGQGLPHLRGEAYLPGHDPARCEADPGKLCSCRGARRLPAFVQELRTDGRTEVAVTASLEKSEKCRTSRA